MPARNHAAQRIRTYTEGQRCTPNGTRNTIRRATARAPAAQTGRWPASPSARRTPRGPLGGEEGGAPTCARQPTN
eukprot:11600488-Alexandrium_andersonii.AAC.1